MPRPANTALPELLLEAARQLLVERGRADFSVRQLCQRVGYSLTAVYRCYENRAALLRALQLRLFSELNAHCVPTASDGAVSGLREAGGRFIEWAAEHPAEYLFMFSDQEPDLLLSSPEDRARAQAGIAGITMLLSAAKAAGQIDIDDPNVVAIQLLAELHGLASLALTGRLVGTVGEDPRAFITAHGGLFFDRLLGIGS